MPNPESSNKNLVIYRASAGAGKTHKLTEEYLRLLFTYPYAYKHILAVTFTNKATDEMKVRIIEELYNLASGRKSDHLSKLMNDKGDSEAKIRETAKKTLRAILHDYSSFSISTIDRFFQQTMRAFTREIGIGGNYNIELDQNKVLKEAVEFLLADLDKSNNKQLLDWLIRFSEEKIENGDTWNIRRDIQDLSSEIFKENYKVFSDDIQKNIADKDFLDNYKGILISIIRNFEKQSKEIGIKALNIIERCSLLPEDFKGGNRSQFCHFRSWAEGTIKEPNNTFIGFADNVDNWFTAKTPSDIKEKIHESFNNGLNDCVKGIINHYNDTILYQTAYEINRYYFALGILGDVDKKIREYSAENNIMLISDTTELLNKIIKDTDSPFIYEKVGTHIDHYMIDEFQDTSGMQWSNFYPLVKDSLSTGNRNLIVGDVKQSIYRWRNSDWKLLEEQLDRDFEPEQVHHETLSINWRSSQNIVDFNNSVFASSSQMLQNEFNESLPGIDNARLNQLSEKLRQAYKNLEQLISPVKKDEEGHVKIEFINTGEYSDWQTKVLEELPSTIEQLQDRGYKLRDIAILVRTKKEGANVANRLLEYKSNNPDSKYKYDIISDEALYVNNSKSIKLAISLLKYLQNPSELSLESLAIHEYYKYKEQLSAEFAIQKYFSSAIQFPEEVKTQLNKIRELPLYEMTEGLFDIFKDAMEENENVYIQSFLDMVLEFTIRYSSDLDAFLQWWKDSSSSKTIFTPDGQDAIRIMTIHKSKGLGFEAVIIPFCNWDIDHKFATILWCQPKIEPFDQLKLVPVKYSQKLKNTIFAYEYFNEKMHAFIDNLNIMYVAFTRAKKDLIIFAPQPNNDKLNNISSVLWQCVNTSENFDNENNTFETGENFIPVLNENVSQSDREIKINSLSSISFDKRLRLKLNNKYYFSEKGQREYGTLMHEIISKIKTINDLRNTVDEYFLSGDITSEEKENIFSTLNTYLSKPEIAVWYSADCRILNEVQILQPIGSFIRPDRVIMINDEVTVIDYKFGEKENNKYIKQVKYYVSQIKKMGYEKVKGYICYISLDKIIKV